MVWSEPSTCPRRSLPFQVSQRSNRGKVVQRLLTYGRDAAALLQYRIVSETTYAVRHSVTVSWNKVQEPPQVPSSSDVTTLADGTRFSFTMSTVATPDAKQSEAYVSTVALFYIFSNSPREEKVNLRLPAVWRDLWSELAETKKSVSDAQDRTVVKELRGIIRQRLDQELEDGVILQGAFRGRGNNKPQGEANEGTQGRLKQNIGNGDIMRTIWADKSGSHKYQQMLVCHDFNLGNTTFEANI